MEENLVVLKFGGKSLADRTKIGKIARYIKQRCKSEKVIVVVSAMGDCTDKLLLLAKKFCAKPNAREMDMLLSCGENVSASLMAIRLNGIGVKTCSLMGWQAGILAEGEHNKGTIYAIEKSAIEEKLLSNDCVVVAGFQALDRNGDVITLGRGGSDTTAVALGAAFDCHVEIFSDFNGICAGDPREQNFRKYSQVDYDTAVRYAGAGAKVLSKTSTQIAKEAKVDVTCKSSQKPNLLGTKLTSVPTAFAGINIKRGLCEIDLIYTHHSEMLQKTVKFVLQNVEFQNILIEKDKVSIFVDETNLETVKNKLSAINNLT